MAQAKVTMAEIRRQTGKRKHQRAILLKLRGNMTDTSDARVGRNVRNKLGLASKTFARKGKRRNFGLILKIIKLFW